MKVHISIVCIPLYDVKSVPIAEWNDIHFVKLWPKRRREISPETEGRKT